MRVELAKLHTLESTRETVEAAYNMAHDITEDEREWPHVFTAAVQMLSATQAFPQMDIVPTMAIPGRRG